ncbi:dioxygenase [Streptosporangium sp. NPDC006013]|uniref:dioxygenase family protein n=1 Tax=Streptosporangium sp. NPDC006013 TaxID=3155596 RepID=UPI0033B5D410
MSETVSAGHGPAGSHPVTEQVVGQLQGADTRLMTVMESLIRHLHGFVEDVRPTAAEWEAGLAFLARTGSFCTPTRQEFVLLSDMLGLTTLVDDVNNQGPADMTPSSVEGPFHSVAPPRELGDLIAAGPEWGRAESAVIHGTVQDCHGNRLPGAILDVWQADDKGHYDTQDAEQPEGNLRGLFTADENGEYWFRTVKPASYPVPMDGPAGDMLRAMGRHPMRPGHLHIRVEAAGHHTLTTHVFVNDDPYLDSDAAFAVKPEIIVAFEPREDQASIERYGMDGPYLDVTFDIRLATESEMKR